MRCLRLLPLSILLAAVLSVAAATAQQAAPAARIVNPIDEKQLVTLTGSMHPLANARNDRGAIPDETRLDRMHLVLKRSSSQEAALRTLITEMHTPGTASYHKWLTPESFGKQFGPSDQDIATVENWLTGHGFSVAKVNPGKQTLEFSGSAGQFRSAFHAQIHKYEVKGQTHFANSGDPQIPAALAPVVGGFVSLNNFQVKSYAKYLGKAQYDPKTDHAKPEWTVGNSTDGYTFVLAPQDYAVQYDLNPLYSAGTNGSGQTIAIINEANINIGLVNSFRSIFGLPVNPPQVIIDGNDPGIDGINNPDGENGASVEAYLDVEWAGAVAPNATVDLVIGADTELENGLTLAMEHAVYGNVAPVMSLSFGSCEATIGAAANAFFNTLWEQAAAQGITVMVSSGDSGSAGCDDDDTQEYATLGLGINGFASTPYNVAVGGTDFYYSDFSQGLSSMNAQIDTYWNATPSNSTPAVSLLKVVPEQPWNDSQYGDTIATLQNGASPTSTSIAAGSGGASTVYTTKPAWQTGFGDTARDIPDVSLFASNGVNASYIPICAEDGDCQPVASGDTVQISGVGGTSASSPSFAGIMALVNQKYGRQGQADFVLYPLNKQFPAAFNDVANGTNAVPCAYSATAGDDTPDCIAATTPVTITDSNGNSILEGEIGTGTTPDYNAVAGYDLASGLGTVDASQLVADWNKVTFAGTTTTLTPSLTSFAHGTPITISGTVTPASGTATGDVALVTSSTEEGQQGVAFYTLSGGAFTGSISTLPGGSYNIWGQYGGDTANALSTSTPVPITVTPEASGVYFNAYASGTAISSGTTGIAYGTQITLSAQPAPSSKLSSFEGCTTACPVFTEPTGTVAFADSGTALNTAVINATGDAEYTPPATFSVGSHSVTASYSGDQSYGASTASPITFTVVQSAPSVLLASPYSTYAQGQVSTLSVLVEGYGNGVAPTGTVTLSGAPAGTLSSATLSATLDPDYDLTAGIATFVIPATASTGSYNITAAYTPSGASVTNYGAATSSAYPLAITGASGIATTTTAGLSSGATSPSAVITVNGSVKAASGAAPTGTVYILATLLDVSNGGGSAAVYSIGSVTLTPGSGTSSTFSFTANSSELLRGANQITLQYAGSTTDSPSAALVNVANPLSDFQMVPSTTILPVTAGSSGTVAINLASTNGFSGAVSLTCTPASVVTCSIPASESLNAYGGASATLTISAAAGAANGTYNVLVTGKNASGAFVHTVGVAAVIAGGVVPVPGFTLSNSAAISVVAGATTGNTSTVSITPTDGFTGAVALTCAVTGPAGAVSPVTCTIPASETISGAGAVTATLTAASTATTTPGAYVITVTGTSAGITETTTANVTVTAVPTPSFALSNSASISISQGATTGNTSTVSVTPSNGFTGTVALTCATTTSPTGAASPVTCSIPASADVTGATAVTETLTVDSTSTTSPGVYVVTITGTSGAITETTTANVTVTSAVTPVYGVTASAPAAIAPGGTASSTITVNSTTGYAGTVTITCALTSSPTGASDLPACSGGAGTITLSSGTTSGTTTVSVTTTAATTSELVYPRLGGKGRGWAGAGGGAVLALLVFLWIPARRRNMLSMLGVLMLMAALGTVIGCGGGGGGGGGMTNPGTTAGTYTFTVTATGSPAQSTGNTTTFTVTVN